MGDRRPAPGIAVLLESAVFMSGTNAPNGPTLGEIQHRIAAWIDASAGPEGPHRTHASLWGSGQGLSFPSAEPPPGGEARGGGSDADSD